MTITDFLRATTEEVGGLATEGRGRLALVPNEDLSPPLLRLGSRDTYETSTDEQSLLAHIIDVVSSAGFSFSRAQIINYYVSLKTNPFIILTGSEDSSRMAFVRLFAEALVGPESSQFALITSGSSWVDSTGEDQYYRSLHERFGSWRFLDLLQEAADPGNIGKVYLVCFGALHPNEIEYYFGTLLHVGKDGTKRLNLPGFPPDRQPFVPPNVYITATINDSEHTYTLSSTVLRHASLIDFRTPKRLCSVEHRQQPQLPPPVGFQRLWLRTSHLSLETARERLGRLLGSEQIGRLHSSQNLSRLLWRGGIVLSTHTLNELTTYIANSFDEQGRGLFDPYDAQRNARLAFDAQVVQRVLWRLRDSQDSELRRDLADYLDQIARAECRQAVA